MAGRALYHTVLQTAERRGPEGRGQSRRLAPSEFSHIALVTGKAQGRRHGFLSRGVESSAEWPLPQNTLKIVKTPDFGHFNLESGGVEPPGFQKCGGPDPPDTPVGDAPGKAI